MKETLLQLAPTLTVVIVGAIAYLLRSVPMLLLQWLGWACTVTLTVNNDDTCFDWINEWLATHTYSKKARTLKVESGREQSESWTISPGYGIHWFWDNGLVFITRNRVENKNVSWRAQEQFTI